jgi:hypothetical protein
MKRIAWPGVFVVFGALTLGLGASRYQTEADRREYADLLKIKPPADAVELKIERSFPSAEQEEAGHFLNQPRAFIMDGQGRFYISDQNDHIVYRFDSRGQYLGQFGRQGQGPGDLSIPKHLQILDDEIAVNELGNMRIQYFTLEGVPLRSVRRPHDYWDLVILPYRGFVGAPLGVEPNQKAMLIDVVSPEGKIIREFGEPVPFEYHQSTMNSRKILVNADREIILFFDHLSIVRKYSMDGRLLWEKQIETPFSAAKDMLNRRANSSLPDHRPAYRGIVGTAGYLDGFYFISDQVGSRLWIWEMNEKLSILRTYYAELKDQCFVEDIIPIKEHGRMRFSALVLGGEEEPKIHVLVPKN